MRVSDAGMLRLLVVVVVEVDKRLYIVIHRLSVLFLVRQFLSLKVCNRPVDFSP